MRGLKRGHLVEMAGEGEGVEDGGAGGEGNEDGEDSAGGEGEGQMDLSDMLWMWAFMQGGNVDRQMDSISTLDSSIAAILVVLIAACSGSVCCSADTDCGSRCNSGPIGSSSCSSPVISSGNEHASSISSSTTHSCTASDSSNGSFSSSGNDSPGNTWKIRRQSTYWDNMVYRRQWTVDERVRDSHWHAQYRMSYRAFQTLIFDLSPYIERSANKVGEPIEPDRMVAMVLHRLAFGLSPTTIANLYNVGPSAVTEYTKQITEILSSKDKIYPKYVSMPSEGKLASTIDKFYDMTGIPNICGVIDGTHVKLWRRPRLQDVPRFYRNEYKFYSILLQGVCDSEKVFWDVCCNTPGSQHDEQHFRASTLRQKLKSQGVLEQPIASVQGRKIRPFIVGDEGYHLAPFMITPFGASEVPPTEMQQDFNVALSKAHSCVKNAFGILKRRWGILENLDVGLQDAPQVVVACCVLHNFCQLAGEKEPDNHVDNHPNNSSSRSPLQSSPETDFADYMTGRGHRDALLSEWAEQRGGLRTYQSGNEGVALGFT